jgi:CubicO group peptidase (beta-lactamase class C family)
MNRDFRLGGLSAAAFMTLSAAGLLAGVAPPAGSQRPRPSAQEIARAVDSVAARAVAGGVVPGLGIAVVLDGRTILSKAYGFADATNRIPATENTLWYLASTSKSYTGFGVSLLAQQKVIDFNAPITELLPDATWPAEIDASRITLAQFLSHTHHINGNVFVQNAAFTGVVPEREWAGLIRYVTPTGNQNLVYSNFGYNIAAMVIDRKRPEGWRRYLENAVYKPAGLTETYAYLTGLDTRRIAKPHSLNADGAFTTDKFEKTDATMNSAGGHVATLRDLARWTIVQMDGGRIDGKQVFPAEAVELSHRLIARHTVESSKRFGPFTREGWGAGWDLGSYAGEPMVSRFGSYSATRSHLSTLPGRHIGVVAQANGGALNLVDIIAAFVYDLEAGLPNARSAMTERIDALVSQLPAARRSAAASDSTRRSRQRPLKHSLAAYAGSYDSPGWGTLELRVENGALRFRWGVLEGPTEVYDAEKDQLRFEVAGSGSVMTFRFDGGESAKAVDIGGGAVFTRR